MDCFFVVLKCRVCEIFRTFRFSRFLHVSFFKSSTFRFAGFILVCGIIASIICLFNIVWVQNPEYQYIDDKIFSPSGFVTTVMVLASSLISWSFMRVLANISVTLKAMNKKMK